MFLLLNLYDYEYYNLFYGPKKANMIMDGSFTKCIYSNEYVTLYGLFFDLPLKITSPIFSNASNIEISCFYKEIIHKLLEIEKHLLATYSNFLQKRNVNKNAVFCLYNQIQTGYLKYYRESGYVNTIEHLYIKISGIWENDKDFGITFKIIQY